MGRITNDLISVMLRIPEELTYDLPKIRQEQRPFIIKQPSMLRNFVLLLPKYTLY